jgi:hypothetical protein
MPPSNPEISKHKNMFAYLLYKRGRIKQGE